MFAIQTQIHLSIYFLQGWIISSLTRHCTMISIVLCGNRNILFRQICLGWLRCSDASRQAEVLIALNTSSTFDGVQKMLYDAIVVLTNQIFTSLFHRLVHVLHKISPCLRVVSFFEKYYYMSTYKSLDCSVAKQNHVTSC